nr:retrovirus-related Pol polyprotein from transposon TNT 1-94 [Tanacetum cinerariifolium]
MSRDVITVGSTMRISLLYRGEYSQWRERFMDYLEEKTDGEAMINSIQNGDHPLPVVAQVSLARTVQNAHPTLKDLKFWTAEEKMTRKIDRLARSLLIQGLLNDIYSLIDSNETTKDLWDALERKMRGSEYGEQDRKVVILYEYETFKTTEGEQLLDTYLRYLQKAVVVTSDPLALVAEKTKANKKPEYVKSVEKKEDKKDNENKRDMSKVKCYNCKKEGHFTKDCKKAKVKDYNYYKTKMLLAKKDSDEQVLLAEDQAWMESSSDSNQEINANMVFMAKMEKVLSDSDESSSSVKETIAEQTSSLKPYVPTVILEKILIDLEDEVVSLLEKEKANLETIEYLKSKGFESSEYVISKPENQSENDCQVVEKECDKVENSNVIAPRMFKLNVSQSVLPISVSKTSCASKNVKNKTKRKIHKRKSSKQNDKRVNNDVLCANRDFIHFLDLDTLSSVRRPTHSGVIWKKKGSSNTSNVDLSSIKIDSPFQQTSSLKPYVPNVILEKIIIDLEVEVVSLLEKEKANLKTIESLKSKGFESSENAIFESENQSENDCHVVEKECDQVDNSKVIAPGMFKLSVSQSVSPISMSKTFCDSNNVESKLKRKRRKRKSSKQNDKQVDNDVSHANRSFVHFLDLDTFSSVRRPKHSSVIWKKKGRLILLIVRISPVSKMPFRKKPRDSMNVCSKNNSNKSLPRTVHRWPPKMQPLAEPVAKWIPRIVQICLWIIDSGCSKHMTGNSALLTNFVENFLGTVRLGNNDFAVIDGYGDVVIGSMTIKKVYYVEGLGHNLFSVGQFCDKGLESTCFVCNEDGVDLLTGDRSSNLYTIALNEVASNSSTCLLAKASSLQSWLWHQRLSHLNFTIISNLVKYNFVQGLPKMKFKKDHLCFACEQGKIHRKHHKSKMTFA